MFKYLLTLSLLFSLSTASFAAGVVQLVDLVGKKAELTAQLILKGFTGAEAEQFAKNLGNSLEALGVNANTNSNQTLSLLKKLKLTSKESIKIQKELDTLLKLNIKNAKKGEIEKVLAHAYYLAEKNGTSALRVCNACGGDVIQKVSKEGEKALAGVPTEPEALATYLTKTMSDLKLSKFQTISPEIVKPDERRAFALYLGYLQGKGTKSQQKLAKEIAEFSDNQFTNRMWEILIAKGEKGNDLDEKEIEGWILLLKDAKKMKSKDPKLSDEEAFLAVLEKRAGNDEELKKSLEAIKKKHCYFPR